MRGPAASWPRLVRYIQFTATDPYNSLPPSKQMEGHRGGAGARAPAAAKGKGGLPAISGAAKAGSDKPSQVKIPSGNGAKAALTPTSPAAPAAAVSPRAAQGRNAFAVASAGGRLAATAGLAAKRTGSNASSSRSPRGLGSPRTPRDTRSPRGGAGRAGSLRGGARTVSAPVPPPNPGGVLQHVLAQVFPDAVQRLAVTLRLAHCGIYSAAELWYGISTISDAHFYKIPKPYTYERKARLVNELVVRSTAEQDIFSEQILAALMGLLDSGERVCGEPKAVPANDVPMETQMHCALLCCDVLGLRRKLMRIGTRTAAQFAECAKGLDSTALFQLEINKQLKQVGERPVGKDTLEGILAFFKVGTEFAKQQVAEAEASLRADLAPLKVGAIITRAGDVDGIELAKLDEAQDKADNDEAKVKAAVVQLIVDKNRPTPCPVPMYGTAGTAGTPASGSWVSVEATESADGAAAAVSSAHCVWLKGNLPIIIGLPYNSGAGDSGLWELGAALRTRFLETSAKVPHIIVSTKPQAELDCSMQFSDLASPSEDVSNAWKNYHTFIEIAKSTIREAAVISAGTAGKANDTAVFVELCASQATEGSEAALNMCHIGYRIQPRMISKCMSIIDGGGGEPVDKNDPEVKAQIESAFSLFDIDGSGDIDSSELAGVAKELVRPLCLPLVLC